MCVCVCVRAFEHVPVIACVRVYMWMCVYTGMCACVCVYRYVCVCVYVCVFNSIHVCVYVSLASVSTVDLEFATGCKEYREFLLETQNL